MGDFRISENSIFFSNGKTLVPALPNDATKFLNGVGAFTVPAGSGNGTVTSVSVVTANGISGSVANPTTTPALTLALGAITPTSVAASGNISGANIGNVAAVNFDGNASHVLLGNGGFGASPGGSGTPLYPDFTTPVNGDFAWINQGGATVTVNGNGGIYLNAPANSGQSVRLRKKSAPATPYTITAAILPALVNIDFQTAGICFRESGSGKIIALRCHRDSSASYIIVTRLDSPTTFNTNSLLQPMVNNSGFHYLRITDDGTNRKYSYSLDGYNFIQLFSEGRTTYITADEIGFFASEQSNSYACGLTLLSWAQT